MERSAAGELDGATGSARRLLPNMSGTPAVRSPTPARSRDWPSIVRAICRARAPAARRLTAGRGGRRFTDAQCSRGTQSRSTNPTRRGRRHRRSAYVSPSYTVGSLAVPLQSALANAHSNGATVAWDVFVSAGPGLNGFTPTGVGIEEEALYDPVSAKYYIERAATQDGCAPQNVVIEAPGLWNGTTIDRAREVIGDGQAATGIAVKALMLWNGATYDRASGSAAYGLYAAPKPLAPVATSVAASSLVLKSAAGNLMSLMATSTVSGWLMLFDATTAPETASSRRSGSTRSPQAARSTWRGPTHSSLSRASSRSSRRPAPSR